MVEASKKLDCWRFGYCDKATKHVITVCGLRGKLARNDDSSRYGGVGKKTRFNFLF